MQQLVRPLGRPQLAAYQPNNGIDHANQRQVWKMMTLGDNLRADQQVDLAPVHGRDQFFRLLGPAIRSDVISASRASGNCVAASSASRSTPGPQGFIMSSAPQEGHSFGRGVE